MNKKYWFLVIGVILGAVGTLYITYLFQSSRLALNIQNSSASNRQKVNAYTDPNFIIKSDPQFL